jgi:hypothetical protein
MGNRPTWHRMLRIVRIRRYVIACLVAAAIGTVVFTPTPWAQLTPTPLAQENLQPIAKELTTITDKLGHIIELLGTISLPTGGPVSGSLYYQAAVKDSEPGKADKRIFLPDIEVFLHNTASGVDSPAVTTDLFGRYRFPRQAPGIYELHWKTQRGWAAGSHPDSIVIGSGPHFPVPARIQPDERSGVIFGRVTLGDGGTPWSYDELFNVNHTATVTILNVARTATLAGPLHTNSEGDYAAAGLPRSEPTTIQVSSQAAIVTRAVDGTRVSTGNPVSPTTCNWPTSHRKSFQ